MGQSLAGSCCAAAFGKPRCPSVRSCTNVPQVPLVPHVTFPRRKYLSPLASLLLLPPAGQGLCREKRPPPNETPRARRIWHHRLQVPPRPHQQQQQQQQLEPSLSLSLVWHGLAGPCALDQLLRCMQARPTVPAASTADFNFLFFLFNFILPSVIQPWGLARYTFLYTVLSTFFFIHSKLGRWVASRHRLPAATCWSRRLWRVLEVDRASQQTAIPLSRATQLRKPHQQTWTQIYITVVNSQLNTMYYHGC